MNRLAPLVVGLALAGTAAAQTFTSDPAAIPSGAPFNAGFTENVELFDIDGDGDSDALWANGGDFGVEQNRLWINRGGLQGGATGVFRDETAARYPSVLDDSRDVDFVDLDLDGDLDLFVSNTSGIANQTNRFLVNMGGAQGGTPGYFQDQTASRWIGLGVNSGASGSSVAPSLVLAGGGFVDWSCDTSLADLDGDGDLDLVQATYGTLSLGKVPTRLFLNDGQGHFEEFNPSGYQLSGTDIPNGAPGLWCEGTQQHATQFTDGTRCDIANESISVDVGDFDADFDLDFVLGEKTQLPRAFRNRTLESGGALGFRDESWSLFPGPDWAPSSGSYEQDLGDLDNDGDLDLFGTNWSNVCDAVLFGGAGGVFSAPVVVPNSCVRHNEPDLIDYDNDGWLDVFTASRTAPEEIYRNLGPAGGFAFDLATAGALPGIVASALGADAVDSDLDGDYDLLVANDSGEPQVYLRNGSGTPDTHAPRVPRVEALADRPASPAPSFVRAHVLDNAAWYIVASHTVELEISRNGGPFTAFPMHFIGGQLFHGALSTDQTGSVSYRVRASDTYGNTVLSSVQSFTVLACQGAPSVYCTPKTHSNGCVPQIASSGVPSLSAGSGFVIRSSDTLENKAGLLFYGTSGPRATPYQGGWLCVQPPTRRTPLLNSGAAGQAPCAGEFSFDFNVWLAAGNVAGAQYGTQLWAQFWSRDPLASFQSNRTAGIHFFVCP